jgi:hypothetical protein
MAKTVAVSALMGLRVLTEGFSAANTVKRRASPEATSLKSGERILTNMGRTFSQLALVLLIFTIHISLR